MKKILSFVLVLVMLLGLVSCFQPIDPPTGSTTTTTKNTTTTTTTTTNTNKPLTSTTTTTTTNKNTGSGNEPGGNTGNDSGNVDVPVENPNLDSFDPDELATFQALFDYNNHVELKLDISDSELQKIQKDYENYSSFGSKSPIYRMADLYVTITKPNGEKLEYVIYQVGVRMKGNTSRTHFWDSNSGMYNLVHFKISFQETFDKAEYYGSDALTWTDDAARKARKNRTFATLEKIDMRWNRNDDPTYIRENYAYDFYREHGVLAPHTTLASVGIGNDHAGVWVIYEPIDKIFLEKNLSPEALGGDLYKLGWTYQGATFTKFESYGIEDEDAGQFYIYDLKTNKKTSDHSSLKNLINTINSSACTKDSFEKVVDIDSFLMFCATSYMIGNPDDLRNNYNNCYVYFRADNGKAVFIPYDMDRGFGVNTWNPYGNGMTTDSPFQNYNVCGDQRNPLFKKTIQNNGFFKNEYIDVLKFVAQSEMLTTAKFKERFDIAAALYSDDSTPSKRYGNAWDYNFTFDYYKTCGAGSSSCMSFKDYINAKKTTLAQYIDGYVPDIDNSTDNGGNNNSGNENNNNNNQYDPNRVWELYLRGNFYDNNWSNQAKYKFVEVEDGVYKVDISVNQQFKFKVYDNRTNGWYNTVTEDCVVEFEYQGGNRNVQLQAGSYTIYFDTKTETINIEKK